MSSVSTAVLERDNDFVFAKRLSIALIGPEDLRRSDVSCVLAEYPGVEAREFASYPTNVATVSRLLAKQFDIVMVDLDSDPKAALDLVESLRGDVGMTVIVYTEQADPDVMARSMRAGARESLVLPVRQTMLDRVFARVRIGRPTHVRPPQAQAAQSQPTNVQAVQADPAQMQPVDARPVEVEAVQIQPVQPQTEDGTPTLKPELPVIAEPVDARLVQAEPPNARPARAEWTQDQYSQAEPVQALTSHVELVDAQTVQVQLTQAPTLQEQAMQVQPVQTEPMQAEPVQIGPAHVEFVDVRPAPKPEPAAIAAPEAVVDIAEPYAWRNQPARVVTPMRVADAEIRPAASSTAVSSIAASGTTASRTTGNRTTGNWVVASSTVANGVASAASGSGGGNGAASKVAAENFAALENRPAAFALRQQVAVPDVTARQVSAPEVADRQVAAPEPAGPELTARDVAAPLSAVREAVVRETAVREVAGPKITRREVPAPEVSAPAVAAQAFNDKREPQPQYGRVIVEELRFTPEPAPLAAAQTTPAFRTITEIRANDEVLKKLEAIGTEYKNSRFDERSQTPEVETRVEVGTLSFHSDLDGLGDEDDEDAKRKKWVRIGAIGFVVLVLLIFFGPRLFSSTKPTVAPQPAQTPAVSSGPDAAAKTPKPSPSTSPSSNQGDRRSASPANGGGALALPPGTKVEDAVFPKTGQKPSPSGYGIDLAPGGTKSAAAPIDSTLMNDQLESTPRIPKDVKERRPEEAPPATGFNAANTEEMASNAGAVDSVFSGESRPRVNFVPYPPVVIPVEAAEKLLIHKTLPVYPPNAWNNYQSGKVVLEAVVAETGSVESLKIVSGPKVFQQAALDAVKSWRYKPYMVNDKSRKVQTTVTLLFDPYKK